MPLFKDDPTYSKGLTEFTVPERLTSGNPWNPRKISNIYINLIETRVIIMNCDPDQSISIILITFLGVFTFRIYIYIYIHTIPYPLKKSTSSLENMRFLHNEDMMGIEVQTWEY